MVHSQGEQALAFQLKATDLPEPFLHYEFHPTRKWQADFAWPELRILAEVEGATWSRGRHVRGQGYENDCRKYNAATKLGWRVYRFTTAMVESGEALQALGEVLCQKTQ